MTLTNPAIPPELLHEVVQNLTFHSDRHTLLDLAVVSRQLCVESQRILFRGTSNDSFWWRWPNHYNFLSSISRAPDRLGPLVKVYVQEGLSYSPKMAAQEDISTYYIGTADPLKLWTATAIALPSMINLEHLTFGSILQSPAAETLQNCSFRLKSLHWRSAGDSEALCTNFLPSQDRMEHLDLECFNTRLPVGVCPQLKSIRATQAMWLSLREERPIQALDMIIEYRRRKSTPYERLPAGCLIDRDVRFLACERFALLQQVVGDGTLRNLKMLQINKTFVFDMETLSLYEFNNMRVLVFVYFERGGGLAVHLGLYLPKLFARNQRLEHIDVEMDYGTFHRYYRDELTPRIFQFDYCYTWVENHLDDVGSKGSILKLRAL